VSDIEFRPESWAQAAHGLDAEAGELAAAWARLARSVGDPAACGCTSGGTLADMALAIVLPAMVQAAGDTVAGIAAGLRAEASLTAATGADYATVEADNEALATQIPGSW